MLFFVFESVSKSVRIKRCFNTQKGYNEQYLMCSEDSLIFIGLSKNGHKSMFILTLFFEPVLTLKMVPGGHSDLKPSY